jgi:hypothetical protein
LGERSRDRDGGVLAVLRGSGWVGGMHECERVAAKRCPRRGGACEMLAICRGQPGEAGGGRAGSGLAVFVGPLGDRGEAVARAGDV